MSNKEKTNELSTWDIVLLEKLTGHLLVYKYPTFYGTRMYKTTFI